MAITQYSGLSVRQNGNIYELYIPQGIKVLSVCMPNDGQLIKDASVLDILCKVLALRWRVIKKKGGKDSSGNNPISANFYGMIFMQVDVSGYQIFLPNGEMVVCVLFPPDQQYCADALGLSYICKAMALRYGITQ